MKKIHTAAQAKLLCEKIDPSVKMFESQIQFQKTYNIKCDSGFICYGYTKRYAWNKALESLTPILN